MLAGNDRAVGANTRRPSTRLIGKDTSDREHPAFDHRAERNARLQPTGRHGHQVEWRRLDAADALFGKARIDGIALDPDPSSTQTLGGRSGRPGADRKSTRLNSSH